MSFYEEHSKPMLTEPGVKYFLNATLKQCHTFKESHHNMLFNIIMLIVFLLLLGVLLLSTMQYNKWLYALIPFYILLSFAAVKIASQLYNERKYKVFDKLFKES